MYASTITSSVNTGHQYLSINTCRCVGRVSNRLLSVSAIARFASIKTLLLVVILTFYKPVQSLVTEALDVKCDDDDRELENNSIVATTAPQHFQTQTLTYTHKMRIIEKKGLNIIINAARQLHATTVAVELVQGSEDKK